MLEFGSTLMIEAAHYCCIASISIILWESLDTFKKVKKKAVSYARLCLHCLVIWLHKMRFCEMHSVSWIVLQIILSAFYTEVVQLSMTHIFVCCKAVSWKNIDIRFSVSFPSMLEYWSVCQHYMLYTHMTWFHRAEIYAISFGFKYQLWHLRLHWLFVCVKLRKRRSKICRCCVNMRNLGTKLCNKYLCNNRHTNIFFLRI